MGLPEPASQLSCLVLDLLIGDLCLPKFSSLDSGDRCVVTSQDWSRDDP